MSELVTADLVQSTNDQPMNQEKIKLFVLQLKASRQILNPQEQNSPKTTVNTGIRWQDNR